MAVPLPSDAPGEMKAVTAVCFDLDGTLLDGSGTRQTILRTCSDLAAAQADLDADRLLKANRQVWQAYWPEVQDRWTLGVLDGASVTLEAWSRTLRACWCADPSVAHLALQTHRRHARQSTRLFQDAEAVLAWLARASIPLALITNGASDTQREVVRTLGIEQRFGAVVISGEVGIAKPDPAVFAIAIDRLGVEPQHVWHVGDMLRTDVAGARAAGLMAVWLNRDHLPRNEGDPQPDHEIASLRELARLLSASV